MKSGTKKAVLISSGTLQFSDAEIPKSKLLHQAAKNIGLDGFDVKSIAIFENPLTAIVHLENEGPSFNLLQKLASSTKRALEKVQHNFMITLRLSHSNNDETLNQLTYIIERKGCHRKTDQITIEFANRLSQKIIGSLNTTENQMHDLLLAH